MRNQRDESILVEGLAGNPGDTMNMVQGRKMTNYGPDKMLDLNTSFERYLSKLSDNKNFDIGSSELKLWPFKDVFLMLRVDTRPLLLKVLE